jgi:hypothetical protein
VTFVAAVAAQSTGPRPGAEPVPWPGHVFPAGTGAGAQALAVAALVAPAFLAGAGWDRDRQVLHLAPDHPQFGWSACCFPGCLARRRAGGFCQACHGWLTASGIDVSAGGLDLAALPARPPLFREGACAVRCGAAAGWRPGAAGRMLQSRRRAGLDRHGLPAGAQLGHPEPGGSGLVWAVPVPSVSARLKAVWVSSARVRGLLPRLLAVW